MKTGSVVISLSGKDAGCLMAVVSDTGDVLYVADGRHRPVQRPKKKNPRHLRETGHEISQSSMETNRMLRRELRRILALLNEAALDEC